MKTLSSIVVGVDFTPCAGVALRHAIRLANDCRANLHVVHVIDTLVEVSREKGPTPLQTNIRQGLVKEAEKQWSEFCSTLPAIPTLPLTVVIDSRVHGITKATRDFKADLMVLGAFGETPPDVGLGTLATACVRAPSPDVLLIRDTAGERIAFSSIVAAVDFSETSLRALQVAAALALRDQAELHVLHVCHGPDSTGDLASRLQAFAQPVLQDRDLSKVRLIAHPYAGTRSGLAHYADGISADLIVLGTRGHTNLRDIVLGSTAEKLLEESRCSVFAVKPANPAS